MIDAESSENFWVPAQSAPSICIVIYNQLQKALRHIMLSDGVSKLEASCVGHGSCTRNLHVNQSIIQTMSRFQIPSASCLSFNVEISRKIRG